MGGPFDAGPPYPSYPAYFRYRRLGDAYLITNLTGQWAFLSPEEFIAFLGGGLEPGQALHRRLVEANFIRGEGDAGELTRQMRRRKAFLAYGPRHHVLVVTKRTTGEDARRAGGRGAPPTEMTPRTAEHAVDLALESSAPEIALEFRGGEPLLAFDLVRHAVAYAEARAEALGRRVRFAVLTDLLSMDEAILDFLVAHDVLVRTPVFGPRRLYDAEHASEGGGAFDRAARWLPRIRAAFERAGRPVRLEAAPRITRAVLAQPEAFVDAYLDLGCEEVTLRPLEPFGLEPEARSRLCYPARDYLEFHARALDYMIDRDLEGERILDRYTAVFLTKILGGEDPDDPHLRSPCGAGIGETAYDADGTLYPCDAARLLADEGDAAFRLGRVGETSYHEATTHPKVQTLLFASHLDGAPVCANCAYNPYCGICPLRDYALRGTLQPSRPGARCEVHAGIQDYLFTRLHRGDPKVLAVLAEWAGRLAAPAVAA